MLKAIHSRVTPSTVIATLALVFAMTGGAYAAGHYLITSTKQIKPNVLAQLKGKAGPAGANGANGAPGAQGPGGPQGPQGLSGGPGVPGSPGASVTSAAVGKGASCPEGGSEFTAASGKTFACNGKEGKAGKDGSPWTAGGTLPSGATETGAWGATSSASKQMLFTVSFPIRLKSPGLPSAGVGVVTAKEIETHTIPAGCGGTAVDPEAAPGHLCVFEGGEGGGLGGGSILTPAGAPGAGPTGAIVAQAAAAANEFYFGTFAVTAE